MVIRFVWMEMLITDVQDTEYVFVKRFFLHTFAYRLKETGISIQSVRYGICPDEATGMYTFSRPLEPVLKRALKKSDNLSAEAMFYHLAISRSGKKM